MNTDAEYAINNEKYQVVAVEKSIPPQGIDTGSWYRYVIGQGKSEIVGFKLGSLQAVTEHAYAMVDDLNNRANRGGSFYAPRTRK
ncbi:MAG: hypothetical protein GC149_01830 [Gammaproteobacteria bacterium]|nr:hypothetical protein [Gammaproteobacteria bacterium]